MSRQEFSQPQENRAPSYLTVTWEVSLSNLSLFLLQRFYILRWCHVVLHIPLVHGGHLSWRCPLPTPRAPPAHSWAGQCKHKKPPCCASTAQQPLKHPRVINTISSTNPKHSRRKLTLPCQNQHRQADYFLDRWIREIEQMNMFWFISREIIFF